MNKSIEISSKLELFSKWLYVRVCVCLYLYLCFYLFIYRLGIHIKMIIHFMNIFIWLFLFLLFQFNKRKLLFFLVLDFFFSHTLAQPVLILRNARKWNNLVPKGVRFRSRYIGHSLAELTGKRTNKWQQNVSNQLKLIDLPFVRFKTFA